MIRQIGTKGPLSHELDHDVNNRGDKKREISRTRNRARGIFYFSARNECDLDPNECEKKQQNSVAQFSAVRPDRPEKIRSINKKNSEDREEQNRTKFCH